mmetsp:Transcript_93295/g.269433  ORF Transcript_93295/g.269433 Transcript_93295/m.269433 type:complete len:411 (+) Transcript_93295:119-1351(+)
MAMHCQDEAVNMGGMGMHGGGMHGGGMGGGAMGGGGIVGGGIGGGGMVAHGGGGSTSASCGGMCCEVAAGPTTMSYVGEGRGAYIVETNYRYVGLGAGTFDLTTPKRSMAPLWIGIGLLALIGIGVLAAMLAQGPTSTTSIDQTVGPTDQTVGPGGVGSCLVWGDPHFETFDHSFPSFFEEGDQWLVKSNTVSIQGRFLATPFTNGLAATNSIAVGGPFLHGHTIVVGPLEGGGRITVDGNPVLTAFPSTYDLHGIATLSYNDVGNLVDDAQGHLEKRIVHMDLPSGVRVQVMRWANHINVQVTMPRQEGQDGYCGNFDGIAANDETDQIRARIGTSMPQAERLFHRQVATQPAPSHTLEECKLDQEKYNRAVQLCRGDSPSASPEFDQACIFDVCFAGPQYAAQDAVLE